jgi:hypothetical protein
MNNKTVGYHLNNSIFQAPKRYHLDPVKTGVRHLTTGEYNQ